MFAQNSGQPIARAAADGGDDDPLPGLVMLVDTLGERVEDVKVGAPPGLGEIDTDPAAGIDDRVPLGRG